MKTYTMVFVKFVRYNQIFVRFNHCVLFDIYTTKFNLIPNEINRNKVHSVLMQHKPQQTAMSIIVS